MTTVVNSDSGDGGAAMGIMAILLAAAIGFGVWFFMAHGGGSMPKSETINISAPSVPAPSAPAPAPSSGN